MKHAQCRFMLIIGYFLVMTLHAAHGEFHQNWMNPKSSAATNFFEYANGNWIAQHPVPPSEAEWSIFNFLKNEINLQMKNMLIQLPQHPLLFSNAVNKQLYLYFKSGLDERQIEQANIRPLQKIIDEIHHIHDAPSLFTCIAKLHRIDINVFFNFYPFTSIHQQGITIGALNQPNLILPDRHYYLIDNPENQHIVQHYQKFIQSIFLNLGANKHQAHQAFLNVYQIEKTLAQFSKDRDFFRDPQHIDHESHLDQIYQDYPQLLLRDYLNALKLQPQKINISNPEYLQKLNHWLPKLSYPAIQDYLLASLLTELAPKLNRAYAQPYCEFTKSIRGNADCPQKWQQVLNSANYYLGFAVGDLYVATYAQSGTIPYVTTIFNGIKQSLKRHILQNSWLSPATQQKALHKIRNMTSRIGYPPPLNYQNLNIHSKIYINNALEARRFETQRQWNKINKPINPNEWDMPPQSINAYYSVAQNQINLPLGILQAPFFSIQAPGASNFGGIGVVIGHEIFHGFDDEGAQFDENGVLKFWWTKQEWQHYQQQMSCIIDQFSQYQIPHTQIKVNGKLVCGEAMADLGGLSLALDAYQHSTYFAQDKTIHHFTPLQQFFISFAQIWASNILDQEAQRKGLIDPHPPKMLRVNATLRNCPLFFQAFKLPPPKTWCHLF